MIVLARTSSNVNYRSILSSERMLHKDYESKYSIEKLWLSLKEPDAQMNRMAVNSQT
jgi:hypothetical protein